MEVEGIIKKIGEEQQITGTFKKKELVVTTEEQYPQLIMIEFVQDKTGLLDNFSEGDRVNVGINLRGREWTSPQGEVKYFNSLHGWRIEKKGSEMVESSAPSSSSASMPPMPPMDDDEDDLPF